MIFAPEECGCKVVEEGASLVNSPACSGTYLFMMYLQSYLWGRCDIATPCKRIVSVEEPSEYYDFIVVGAGTAGSIVAGRLSEDPANKVLLIEAGDVDPIGTRVPSLYWDFWGHPEIDWGYRTVPGEDYCRDQKGQGCLWPRGKVLGGCSVQNGMIYHRGHAADYDTWVELGAEGWSWDEVMPYIYMNEDNKEIGTLVKAEHHSDQGTLPIQRFNYQPLAADVIIRAFNSTGIPAIADMNDPDTPVGITIAQAFNNNGQRYSTARAYLEPESIRSNLHVLLKTHVSKVLIEGKKAVGVEYITSNGETKTVRVNKEVILSAGALNSPQILMLSGIGPKEILEKHDIEVIADLPVGQNLKNHHGVNVYFVLDKYNNSRQLDWAALTEYLLNRQGPMSGTGLTQLTALVYSSYAKIGQPDLQMLFTGFFAECSHSGSIGEEVTCHGNDYYNISVSVVALLPRSAGYLTLQSADPLDAPLFYPNYFAEPEDMEIIKEGVQYIKRGFTSEIMREELGATLDPKYNACEDSGDEWSEAWSECMIRTYTDPQNHQVGTTAMGSVLDPELRVYNIENLRVADAGSIPSLPSGNTQGAVMIVAEKCADLVKKTWA